MFCMAPAFASTADCPDLGLSQDLEVQYCAEFQALLYAPFNQNADRSLSSKDRKDMDALIGSDPLWGEVFRSDPKQTLELINRIRQAGGLGN
jgi:hypothetical protein